MGEADKLTIGSNAAYAKCYNCGVGEQVPTAAQEGRGSSQGT